MGGGQELRSRREDRDAFPIKRETDARGRPSAEDHSAAVWPRENRKTMFSPRTMKLPAGKRPGGLSLHFEEKSSCPLSPKVSKLVR